jgi:hypothetical protein
MTNSTVDKSPKDSKITVTTNWQHAQEVPPTFKRLMVLLLEDKGREIRDEQRDSRKSCG